MDIQRWRISGTLLSVPTVSHLFLRNGSVSATVLEILSLHRQSIPKVFSRSYGIQKKIYAVSNGVDTEFFQSRNKEKEKQELHEKYKIPMNRKVVVSAGHLIQRKGILDFLKLAKMMPETTFIWFGGGNDSLVTQEVKEAVKKKSENVIFAGYVEAEELRNAYCGADAFAFFSYEETEGIVVLEALACEVPVVLRDIPVYKGWIQDQMQAYKVHNLEEYKHNLMHIFKKEQEELRGMQENLQNKEAFEVLVKD